MYVRNSIPTNSSCPVTKRSCPHGVYLGSKTVTNLPGKENGPNICIPRVISFENCVKQITLKKITLRMNLNNLHISICIVFIWYFIVTAIFFFKNSVFPMFSALWILQRRAFFGWFKRYCKYMTYVESVLPIQILPPWQKCLIYLVTLSAVHLSRNEGKNKQQIS